MIVVAEEITAHAALPEAPVSIARPSALSLIWGERLKFKKGKKNQWLRR